MERERDKEFYETFRYDQERKRLFDWYSKDSVEMMLVGIAAVYPSLHVDILTRTIFLNRNRRNRVGLVSGCGSGHEPFTVGYLGECMLTGTVIGPTFTSPSSQNILSTIKNVAQLNKGGVLAIISNSQGLVLNFGMATEVCRARGLKVECVAIGDDVANLESVSGRRGSLGILFAFKIAGALSSRGSSLNEIALTMHAVNPRLASIGMCLEPCSHPNQPPLFSISNHEMHVGVGMQGEAGSDINRLVSTPEIVTIVLTKLMTFTNLGEGDNICVIVNDFGCLSFMETAVIAGEVHKQLTDIGCNILRMYADRLLTSLDTNGFQVCVFNVTGKEEWVALLDIYTEAVAWPSPLGGIPSSQAQVQATPLPVLHQLYDNTDQPPSNAMILSEKGVSVMKECLTAVCTALIAEENKLNFLDTGVGVNGTSFKRFCNYLMSRISGLPYRNVGRFFLALSRIADREMSGLLGGIHCLMFLGAGRNSHDWVSLFNGGIELIKTYTKIQLGDRTMFDALIPACFMFTRVMNEKGPDEWRTALRGALEKAARGCDNTRDMAPNKMRTKWMEPEDTLDVDSGAYAVVIWLSCIYRTLMNILPPTPEHNEKLEEEMVSVN